MTTLLKEATNKCLERKAHSEDSTTKKYILNPYFVSQTDKEREQTLKKYEEWRINYREKMGDMY